MRIEARGLVAGYGRRTVLGGVDLSLSQGEVVGLIGPNGAGKSTLLRVLSGVLPPTGGSVVLERDLVTYSARERARLIAFVPQSEAALFDFTVREVVLMGRYAHQKGAGGGTATDHDEATRAMSATDTLQLADRPITALSGGEHRRALLARALAQRSPFLLLDEPTAHLDITHQMEIMSLLHRLSRDEGTGALAALHDVNLAAEYCDRLALLAAGRLLSCGPPSDVLTPELLSRAYGGDLQVSRNPATGRPQLVIPGPQQVQNASGARVHVVCGGGSGLEILSLLHRHGFRLSAGVLNRLDSDEQAAAVLGIPVAVESPFSPIGTDALSACRALMARQQAIVVAPVALGRGNLPNFRLVEEAAEAGTPVFLVGGAPEARDFTGGEGAATWRRLAAAGAREVETPADLPRVLAALDLEGAVHAR